MRKLLLLLVFLAGIALNANAQFTPINETTYINSGKFKYAKEFWMCSSYVKSIDMSLEAFGVALSNEGEWYELIPGKYKQAKDLITGAPNTNYINYALNGGMPVSNVFNVTGRGYGVFEFLFVNKKADFCSMQLNDQAIFRVYVVPELSGFSVNTALCNGITTTKVDLSLNIPNEVQDFAKLMGWEFTFKAYPALTAATNPVSVIGSGIKQYIYKIDDTKATSRFQNKYRNMDANYKCVDSALITHSVTLTNDTISNIPEDISIAYCLANLGLQHSDSIYTVNLNSILKFTAPGGEWSVSTQGGLYLIPAGTDFTKGIVQIDLKQVPVNTTINFTYKFKYDCASATKEKAIKVDLVFGSTQVNDKVVDIQTTICRNLYAGDVKLLEILGIEVPSTAGTWSDESNNLLSTGTINMAQLKTGESYIYDYFVSPAVKPELCAINNLNAKLTINVQDLNGYNSGELQICKDVLGKGQAVNLTNYVADLSATGTKWYKYDIGTNNYVLITNPGAYDINSTNFSIGTNLFKFEHINNCGTAEGELFATVTDRLTNYENDSIKFCYLDVKEIDLFQVLGVAGLKGQWTVDPTGAMVVIGTNFDGKIFKAYDQYMTDGGASIGVRKYKFIYTPTSGEDCTDNKPVTITVIITDNVT